MLAKLSKRLAYTIRRTYTVYNTDTDNPDTDTKSLFTKALFNPETYAEKLLHPYLSTLTVYDANGNKLSSQQLKKIRAKYRENRRHYSMDSTKQNEKKHDKQVERIPSSVSKWTHDNARNIGLPIENRVLRTTGKLPAEIFKLEPLPERLQPFIDNVPSLEEDLDNFKQFVSLKAKMRERVQLELDDFKTTGRKVSPEFHLMDALETIFTTDEETLYRSSLVAAVVDPITREARRKELRGNPELATSHLAKVLIHLMDLPPGVFVYRPHQFKVLNNGLCLSATPDGTLFYCRKAVAFFDEENPSKHDRYDNAQSFGEALTIALENRRNGFSPQVLPQMRLHGNMFSFSLYYFTPDYLKAIQTATATKETKGAHAYHLIWKGKQYGLNLCVKSERNLAFQCLMAASKYLQNPTPDAFPLFENLVKSIEDLKQD